MLRKALEFPVSGDTPIVSLLIGGVLSALGSFLFLPLVPVQGYFVRVLAAGVADDPDPPVFADWGQLTVDGLILLLIQFVYLAVPAVVVFLGLAVSGFGVFSRFGGTSTGSNIEILGWFIMLLGAGLGLLALYLVPAAIANFAYRENARAAFAFGTITDAAFTPDYLLAMVLVALVTLVLGGAAAVLSLVFVGVFLGFYVQVALYFMIGRGFADGLALEPSGTAAK